MMLYWVSSPFSSQSIVLVAIYVHIPYLFHDVLSQSVSSAASETESPFRNIAKAVRRVFSHILIFYVCLLLFFVSKLWC